MSAWEKMFSFRKQNLYYTQIRNILLKPSILFLQNRWSLSDWPSPHYSAVWPAVCAALPLAAYGSDTYIPHWETGWGDDMHHLHTDSVCTELGEDLLLHLCNVKDVFGEVLLCTCSFF